MATVNLYTTCRVAAVDSLIEKANEFGNKARWREKLQALEEALDVCSEGFPDSNQTRQRILREQAALKQSLGQYHEGRLVLLEALLDMKSTMEAKVWGDLGTICMHFGEYSVAQTIFGCPARSSVRNFYRRRGEQMRCNDQQRHCAIQSLPCGFVTVEGSHEYD